jgi:fatty acid-binding protein DegV
MLSIKPLLLIDEGQVVPLERTRTRSRALQGLVGFAKDFPKPARVGVLHGTSPADADQLALDLAAIGPARETMIARMGPVILTHLGPGGMGVVIQEGEIAR